MTPIELALLSLSEASCVEFHRDRDSQQFTELQRDATDAGEIGGDTRKMIEQRMKKSVVSPKNYFDADKAQQQTVTKKGTRGKQASLPSSTAEQTEGKNEGGEPEQKTLF